MPAARIVLLVVLGLTPTAAAEAQRTTGSILGKVIDSSAPVQPRQTNCKPQTAGGRETTRNWIVLCKGQERPNKGVRGKRVVNK